MQERHTGAQYAASGMPREQAIAKAALREWRAEMISAKWRENTERGHEMPPRSVYYAEMNDAVRATMLNIVARHQTPMFVRQR